MVAALNTQDQDASALSGRERIFLGSLGALVLAIATYPAFNKGYVDLILNPDLAEWIGFLLRLIGLTALGAIWGYIHRTEIDAMRAFQLGMVAPATIAGMIYANSPGPASAIDRTSVDRLSNAAMGSTGFSVIGQAHASDRVTTIPLPVPAIGPTFIQRVVKGVFGR